MSLIGVYDVTYNGKMCGSLTVAQEGIRTTFTLTADGCEGVMRLLCACGEKYIPIGIPAPDDNILTLKKTFSKNALEEKGLSSIDGCILLPIGEKIPVHDSGESAPEPDNGLPYENDTDMEQDTECNEEKSDDILPYENDTGIKLNSESSEQSEANIDTAVLYENTSESDIIKSVSGWTPEAEPWRLFSDGVLSEQCRGISGAMILQEDNAILLALPFSLSKPFPLISEFRMGTMARLNDREYVIFRIENGILIPYEA